ALRLPRFRAPRGPARARIPRRARLRVPDHPGFVRRLLCALALVPGFDGSRWQPLGDGVPARRAGRGRRRLLQLAALPPGRGETGVKRASAALLCAAACTSHPEVPIINWHAIGSGGDEFTIPEAQFRAEIEAL